MLAREEGGGEEEEEGEEGKEDGGSAERRTKLCSKIRSLARPASLSRGKKGSIEAHGGRKKIERGSVRAPMGEGESSAGQPKKKSFASLTGSLRFQQAGRQRLAGLASEPCYESPSSRHALRKRKKCRSRSWASIAACCTKRGELRDREVENCRLARSDSNFVWNAPSDVRPRSATTDHRKKKLCSSWPLVPTWPKLNFLLEAVEPLAAKWELQAPTMRRPSLHPLATGHWPASQRAQS